MWNDEVGGEKKLRQRGWKVEYKDVAESEGAGELKVASVDD